MGECQALPRAAELAEKGQNIEKRQSTRRKDRGERYTGPYTCPPFQLNINTFCGMSWVWFQLQNSSTKGAQVELKSGLVV